MDRSGWTFESSHHGTPRRRALTLAMGLVASGGGLAPSRAAAQGSGIPPVRTLGPIVAATTYPLAGLESIRPLSDGRVLVNDPVARRVLLFDSSLARATVIADTTGGTKKAYGAQGGALFPYADDSSLFVDLASRAFLVIEPSGAIARVMAAPPLPGGGAGIQYLRPGLYTPAVDLHGNILARGTPGGAGGRGARGAGAGAGPPAPDGTRVVSPDSTLIVRFNIESRKVDTVAWLMAPVRAAVWTTGPTGTPRQTVLANPMPLQDAWTLMPDGTVAVVREHDYHIDWVAPDGSITSSPKIPHDWVRVTDSAKAAMLDSARTIDSTRAARMAARIDSLVKVARAEGRDVTTSATGAVTIQTDGGGMVSYPPSAPTPMIDAGALPSYVSPFDQAVSVPARADADGNVWIEVASPLVGGATYDVVDRHGALVDRIQIPGKTYLVGFGKGVAYLAAREGAGYSLGIARIR